ncbi:MAG: RNA polymerase sigma factor [Planctomycetaceae bacterium]|nr:RNA polymerase sigma factor [Planctomycetaceae bacterium]
MSEEPRENAGSVTMLLQGMCDVDEMMTKEFWDLFFPRLVAVANKTLANQADAEDIAQETLVKFWSKTQKEGELPHDLNRFEIWGFLSTMTNRQAIDFLRKNTRQKRGGGKIRSESTLAGSSTSDGGHFDGVIGELSFHEFDLVLEELIDALEPEFKSVLICRMMGYTNPEIAEMLCCSERHIRRQLVALRDRLIGSGDIPPAPLQPTDPKSA